MIVGPPLTDCHELCDIEDQRRAAVAENGGAGKHRDLRMKLRQRLDDGLMAADDLVDDQTHPGLAGRRDDDFLEAIRLARDTEQASQPQERHQVAAHVKEVAATNALVGGGELGALLHGRERNDVTSLADPDQ